MARVEISSMPWGTLWDRHGEGQNGVTATLKNLDGTNATTWSAITGGTSSTASLTADASGNLPRFVEGGQYTLDVPALSITGRRVEAVSGSVETGTVWKVAPADMATIFGARYIENTRDGWYGDSINLGDVADSFGFSGSPSSAPATTTTADVTFPLSNATIPVADCAQLSANGGSFVLGGKLVAYLGRSASSGAGNATGCYSETTATGTVASGTTPTNTPGGYFATTIYKRFGYDGRPNPGSSQAFGVIASYKSPTLDDSAEAGSFVTVMADSGSAQTQHKPSVGGEMTAQLGGNWSLPDGYTAPLIGGGFRTQMTATDHAKNVIGGKISHLGSGFWDEYDGLYQTSSALQVYTTLSGAATLPTGTIGVTSGAAMPPATPTNPVTVLIGANADGIGGQVVTYTGISGNNLTGCTGGTGTTAAADQLTNNARAINVKDRVAAKAGFQLGDSGWSGSFLAALRGGTDADKALLLLNGPTNAEVSGGLTLLRLNAGNGQTKSILKAYDTGGTNRFSVGAACQITMNGASINMQQSGTATSRWDPTGFIQPGVSSTAGGGGTAPGVKLYSGASGPPTTLVGVSGQGTTVGDLFVRTDGGVGTTLYRCTATTGGAPPTTPATSVTWTAIL